MMQGRHKESNRREKNNNDAKAEQKGDERKQRALRGSEFISDVRLAFREYVNR